jgi:hypothetical protein
MPSRNQTFAWGLCCPLVLGVLIAVWQSWVGHQTTLAKTFCESLLPVLERTKEQTGHYPLNADVAWWSGKNVPTLIDTNHFFVSDGTNFFFAINVPLAMENLWTYSSRNKRWYNHDGDFGNPKARP